MSWLMAAVYDRIMQAGEEACLAEWRSEIIGLPAGDVIEWIRRESMRKTTPLARGSIRGVARKPG